MPALTETLKHFRDAATDEWQRPKGAIRPPDVSEDNAGKRVRHLAHLKGKTAQSYFFGSPQTIPVPH